MKKLIKRLPDAELAVMQIVWSLESPVTSIDIQKNAAQEWKPTSILTFLARLTEKGFLSCQKQGKQNFYTPLVSLEEYQAHESIGLVNRLWGGSVKSMVASLNDAGALSAQDIEELRHFLDRQEE